MEKYTVYARVDETGRIISIKSSGFLSDTTGWIKIDEGTDRIKYFHAQGNYLNGGVITDEGIPRYKLVDGTPVLRSEEEIAWEAEHPDPISFEQYKKKKLEELSQSCSNIINNGLSIQLSDGSTQSFSYSLEKGDQNNIKEMFDAVCMGAEGFVYHQNDGGCIFYSAQDVLIIYKALSMLKISNTTYYNQLKQYVNSLSNLDEIKAVKYGQELTGEYLQTYNARMQEAEAQFDLIISKLIQNQTI